MTTKTAANCQLKVDEWNQRVKIGDPVTYEDDVGELHPTRTRTEASVLGGHTAVVWVDTGGLTRIPFHQ